MFWSTVLVKIDSLFNIIFLKNQICVRDCTYLSEKKVSLAL